MRVFFLLWSFWVTAAIASPQAVVKITSAACDGSVEYRGSGILLQKAGKVYALTSDHVVLHGDQGYCHRVRSATFGEKKASFVGAEWGNGLALLAVPELSPSSEIPKLEDLAPGPVAAGDGVEVLGFPFDSQVMAADGKGEVLDPKKPSPLFVFVPTLIELRGAHGEFGMSGGPAFTRTGRFLGVLSHQIVEHENLLLLIPADIVYPWLQEALADPEHYLSWFYQSAARQQVTAPEQVVSGHLEFLGFGPPQGGISVHVTPSSHTRAYADATGTLKRWQFYLQGRPDAHGGDVIFFLDKARTTYPTGDLHGFIRQLANPALTPMAASQADDYFAKAVKLGQLVFDLQQEKGWFRFPQGQPPSPEVGKLFDEIDEVCLILPNGQTLMEQDLFDMHWLRVKVAELDGMLNETPAWAALHSAVAGDPYGLARKLKAVRDALDELELP